MEENKCPKCGGKFENGIIRDAADNFVVWKLTWATSTSDFSARQHEIESFRCVNCGYLENYAK